MHFQRRIRRKSARDGVASRHPTQSGGQFQVESSSTRVFSLPITISGSRFPPRPVQTNGRGSRYAIQSIAARPTCSLFRVSCIIRLGDGRNIQIKEAIGSRYRRYLQPMILRHTLWCYIWWYRSHEAIELSGEADAIFRFRSRSSPLYFACVVSAAVPTTIGVVP